MVLSIIVVSHNQKELLRRCLDSILAQTLPFEHEIIISDDASTDGTWELVSEYANSYKKIKAFQINSNDYNPSNEGERGSWNRCNAYSHATGKYIAFVDGDDFFLEGSDIYKKQIELLELHPECSCCMANDYTLDENSDVSQMKLRHQEIMPSGQILSSEIYIRKHFREIHCFVYRRNCDVDPVKLYGGFFEDTVITDHHVQFGDIVCLNDAGYVYYQHQSSVWAQQTKTQDHLLFAHALYIPLLIPNWRMVMLTEPSHLYRISIAVKLAYSGYKIREDNLQWIEKFDIFVYHTFNRKLDLLDKIHLIALWFYLKVLARLNPKIQFLYKVLPVFL